MQTAANNLQSLLDHTGDVQEDYGLAFTVSTLWQTTRMSQVTVHSNGTIQNVDLIKNGSQVTVTKENRYGNRPGEYGYESVQTTSRATSTGT